MWPPIPLRVFLDNRIIGARPVTYIRTYVHVIIKAACSQFFTVHFLITIFRLFTLIMNKLKLRLSKKSSGWESGKYTFTVTNAPVLLTTWLRVNVPSINAVSPLTLYSSVIYVYGREVSVTKKKGWHDSSLNTAVNDIYVWMYLWCVKSVTCTHTSGLSVWGLGYQSGEQLSTSLISFSI